MAFPLIAAAAVSLIGSKIAANSQEKSARRIAEAQQASTAGPPLGTTGPFGSSIFNEEDQTLGLTLSPTLQRAMAAAQGGGAGNLEALNSLDFQGREQAELARLQQLRAPQFAQSRAQLLSQQANRGRLGIGVGGGLTSSLFNPQTAGLEEAIARAQLGDIGAARNFSQQEQAFLLNQAQGQLGIGQGIGNSLIGQAQLGINARTGQGGLSGQFAGAPDAARADATGNFFSGLGSQIGQADFSKLGGFFGGGAPGFIGGSTVQPSSVAAGFPSFGMFGG